MMWVPTLAFLDLGYGELMVVMLVALILYGGKLPEVARTLGRTVNDFKRSARNLTDEFRHLDQDARRPPRRSYSTPEPADSQSVPSGEKIPPQEESDATPAEEGGEISPEEPLDSSGGGPTSSSGPPQVS